MPSVHIPEGPFHALVEEYGYSGAKARVKDLVEQDAGEVNNNE